MCSQVYQSSWKSARIFHSLTTILSLVTIQSKKPSPLFEISLPKELRIDSFQLYIVSCRVSSKLSQFSIRIFHKFTPFIVSIFCLYVLILSQVLLLNHKNSFYLYHWCPSTINKINFFHIRLYWLSSIFSQWLRMLYFQIKSFLRYDYKPQKAF
jgi:hypothetical protein